MPIPVQQFPILSPQQANPLGIGLTTGQNLYQQGINNRSLAEANQQALQGQALANALLQLQLKTAPENLQADLLSKQLRNKISQTNLNYLPETLRAALANQLLDNASKQIKNQYLPSTYETGLEGQKLTNKIKDIQADYLPQTYQTTLAEKNLENKIKQIQAQFLPDSLKNNILSTYLANQKATIENEFLPEQSRLQIDNALLNNALSKVKLDYAPATTQADLAYKQAQVPYLQANTQKLNQETQLAPLASLIKIQQTNQSGSRFGGAYQLSKLVSELSPPVKAAWIAEHQAAYNQMLTDLGNKDNPTLLTPNVVKQFLPVIKGNMDNLSLAHPSVSPGSFQAPTDTLNEQLKRLGQLQANQYLTTTATRRQAEGGQQLAMMINDPQFNDIVNSASVYAGAAGKGKAFLAQLSQSNPKAYEDYRALKQIYMPLVESAIKRLDQLGASNSQREMLKDMFDKTADEWSANPSQFILQFHNLTHAINLVEKSVNASATPAYNVSRKLNNTVTRNGVTFELRSDGVWYPL